MERRDYVTSFAVCRSYGAAVSEFYCDSLKRVAYQTIIELMLRHCGVQQLSFQTAFAHNLEVAATWGSLRVARTGP